MRRMSDHARGPRNLRLVVTGAVLLIAVVLLAWVRGNPVLNEARTWIWDHSGLLGPGPEEERVLANFRTQPDAGVAPPRARVHAEHDGIMSGQLFFVRRYCSREQLEEAWSFYRARLPEFGWVPVRGHPARFRKVVEQRNAALEVVSSDNPGCPGFWVRIVEQKPGR
jgi:hypothetical protein